MLPRFLDPVETLYKQSFSNYNALLFTPYDGKEKTEYLKLLQKAINRQSPLTKEEIEEFFGKDRFEKIVEFLAEDYEVETSTILKDLQ
jgi:hypothetical protein